MAIAAKYFPEFTLNAIKWRAFYESVKIAGLVHIQNSLYS
jgi:hypothetical protein